jgi:hypothetical protein
MGSGVPPAGHVELSLQGCDVLTLEDGHSVCKTYATKHTNSKTIPKNRIEMLNARTHLFLHSYVDEGSTCVVDHGVIADCPYLKIDGKCLEDYSMDIDVSGGAEVDLQKEGSYMVKYSCHVAGFPAVVEFREVIVGAVPGYSKTPLLRKFSKKHTWNTHMQHNENRPPV